MGDEAGLTGLCSSLFELRLGWAAARIRGRIPVAEMMMMRRRRERRLNGGAFVRMALGAVLPLAVGSFLVAGSVSAQMDDID